MNCIMRKLDSFFKEERERRNMYAMTRSRDDEIYDEMKILDDDEMYAM